MKPFRVLLALFVLMTPCFGQAVAQAVWSTSATGRLPTMKLQNSGVAWHQFTFQVTSGTISALTFTVDSSLDCSSWTSGGVVATMLGFASGQGVVSSNTAVYTNCLSVNVTTLTGGGTIQIKYAGFPAATDPCSTWWTHKQVKAFNGVAAANATIVGTAGVTNYVCQITISNAGTGAPTFTFTTGTSGATCGTATGNAYGTVNMITSQVYVFTSGSGELFDSATGNANNTTGRDICLTPGGTTPSASGQITYTGQ